ncbi:NUDIX domain-containing protein [Mycobacterium sp. OTB74]|jgi:8-oxo-dGTP pyrophosphatase MutT (NUDIX family)|uniref:NUDIX hydrolase n=1 Tax=Mycobacterium sp. OTB74 TaxID=1853452 RepID=UPI002476F4FD|nr:NUDIX domain-containing protein [Mycobacterium sp. OTB74]MDH6242441.1 8-oxo-dGTP pyrophosphatase MutT (NUDIX family) [Mycobacterium sp. OTB74]
MIDSLHASVLNTLRDWQAPDPEQDSLRHALTAFAAARPDACRRACEPGHITASALVLDHTRTQALLTLHPRLGRWVQLGGHCEDIDPDIRAAALREASEESGIDGLTITEMPAALHVHALTCSLGVPTRHLDMQYLAFAPAHAEIHCTDESIDLRWWPLDGIPDDDAGLTALVRHARSSASAD